MKKLLLVVLLSGCVSKEQYGRLNDSYEAWYVKTAPLYLAEVKDIPVVLKSRQHEVDAVAQVISSAKALSQ